MLNILHIGSYSKNLGDNIALSNVRKSFSLHSPNIEFTSLDISTFWEDKNNLDDIVKRLNTGKHTAILFGGGGLLEFENYSKMKTFQKLPLSKQILERLEKPVLIYGVGVNAFRGEEEWSEKAIKTLQEIVDNVKIFSVRNDGSLDKLKQLGINTSKVHEIPDPGVIHFSQKEENYSLQRGVFQPARNGSKKINKFRFQEYVEDVLSIPEDLGIPIFPHTTKDYEFKGNFIFDDNSFSKEVKFEFVEQTLAEYYKYDYVVAMRGHGQLITIGMNIPGIYFSTQDKVLDFSIKNGYEEYNVDISNTSWRKQIDLKIQRLKEDTEFVKKWYKTTAYNTTKWEQEDSLFVRKCLSYLT